MLEDHYWDDSDAAVVFKRFDRATGDVRYVYHGNDGTSFPWNDTAQLDFLDPAVREQVIRTILDVARRFPIIRFDAAMVLAEKHIERLWWPEPGTGGGIPSRAEHAIPKAEFDARDAGTSSGARWSTASPPRCPGTLLLAEAFWLLEGYFVRTLGMHRVYNSAFMHMLRDEDGAGYRKVIKETIEFDPEILKRYVNFMSNPDEKTALEQFGKGDKYFGVATRARDAARAADARARPGPGLRREVRHGVPAGDARRAARTRGSSTRHEREIFPLLHRRAWFAEARDFLLYDFVTDGGARRRARLRLLERGGSGAVAGRLPRPVRLDQRGDPRSAGYAVKSPERVEAAGPALAGRGPGPAQRARRVRRLPRRPDRPRVPALVPARSGSTGCGSPSTPTPAHVFWEFREVRDGSPASGRGSRRGSPGAAVPSLDEAMRELQLEPVHGPLRAIFAGGPGRCGARRTWRPRRSSTSWSALERSSRPSPRRPA